MAQVIGRNARGRVPRIGLRRLTTVKAETALLFGLLFAFVVTSLAAIYRHRWDPPFHQLTASLTVRRFTQHMANGGVQAIFVFAPIDCERSLSVIDTLNEVSDHHPGAVRGFMIATESEMPAWKDVPAGDRIDFPVSLVDESTAAALLAAAAAKATPVTLSSDGPGIIRTISATTLLRTAGPLQADEPPNPAVSTNKSLRN